VKGLVEYHRGIGAQEEIARRLRGFVGETSTSTGLTNQCEIVAAATAGIHQRSHHVLLCLQHQHVYTAGRRVASESFKVPVVGTDRGGEVTYHGPGQLLMYPVVDLRELKIGAR
jgi:lipoate-protein ligase B